MFYDGLGRRIRKEVGYARDSNGDIVEVSQVPVALHDLAYTYNFYYAGQSIIEERNRGGGVIRQYVWDSLAGQYVDSLAQVITNHDDFYPLQDRQFNVIGLVNRGGRLVERYKYDAYGKRTVYSHGTLAADYDNDGIVENDDYDIWRDTFGSTTDLRADGNGDGIVNSADFTIWGDSNGDALSANDPLVTYARDISSRAVIGAAGGNNIPLAYGLCPIGHQGLYHDEETGSGGTLIYNRARMRHAELGRFIQRDPIGYPDGMNAYASYHVMRGGVDPTGNLRATMHVTWERWHDHYFSFEEKRYVGGGEWQWIPTKYWMESDNLKEFWAITAQVSAPTKTLKDGRTVFDTAHRPGPVMSGANIKGAKYEFWDGWVNSDADSNNLDLRKPEDGGDLAAFSGDDYCHQVWVYAISVDIDEEKARSNPSIDTFYVQVPGTPFTIGNKGVSFSFKGIAGGFLDFQNVLDEIAGVNQNYTSLFGETDLAIFLMLDSRGHRGAAVDGLPPRVYDVWTTYKDRDVNSRYLPERAREASNNTRRDVVKILSNPGGKTNASFGNRDQSFFGFYE